MPGDSDRETVALLHRRAGWGLAPGELDARLGDGVAATIDRLVEPDNHGVPPSPDPWAGVDLTPNRPGPNATQAEKQQARQADRQQAETAIAAWLDHLASTPRPLEEWMAWFWHGHFVSGLDKVKVPLLMVQQLRTYRSLAFAPFPELVRAATTDPAMLLYLDGGTSTGSQPNENYGRELLELFTLGIGNYGEADVQAGAKALTGWTIDRRTGNSSFAAARHDNTAQRYLDVDNVHDVDTVVAAVTAHPACAPFVAGKLARTILGASVDDALVHDLATTFAASGLDTRVLVRAILEAAASGRAQPTFVQPVPWLVAAERATGSTPPGRLRLAGLRAAGQVPMLPPNVAGWPLGPVWLGASTVVARYNLASALAASTPADNPALAAAAAFDLDALADSLARPDGFANATRSALTQVKADPRSVLALALASPELSLC
ncbi:MAG: hypothetical protein QOG30_1287 [Acidimicrobiaceae bacterium]